jgi:hypothetical protein
VCWNNGNASASRLHAFLNALYQHATEIRHSNKIQNMFLNLVHQHQWSRNRHRRHKSRVTSDDRLTSGNVSDGQKNTDNFALKAAPNIPVLISVNVHIIMNSLIHFCFYWTLFCLRLYVLGAQWSCMNKRPSNNFNYYYWLWIESDFVMLLFNHSGLCDRLWKPAYCKHKYKF